MSLSRRLNATTKCVLPPSFACFACEHVSMLPFLMQLQREECGSGSPSGSEIFVNLLQKQDYLNNKNENKIRIIFNIRKS